MSVIMVGYLKWFKTLPIYRPFPTEISRPQDISSFYKAARANRAAIESYTRTLPLQDRFEMSEWLKDEVRDEASCILVKSEYFRSLPEKVQREYLYGIWKRIHGGASEEFYALSFLILGALNFAVAPYSVGAKLIWGAVCAFSSGYHAARGIKMQDTAFARANIAEKTRLYEETHQELEEARQQKEEASERLEEARQRREEARLQKTAKKPDWKN
jgi:hypothetical protein